MAGQHDIWDWQAYNESGVRVEAGRAMVYGAGNEEAILPAGAGVGGFAGISVYPADDKRPIGLRRIGSIQVKVSGAVAKGQFGEVAGTDGRVRQLAAPGYAVGIFEEAGSNNDLVVMTVMHPAPWLHQGSAAPNVVATDSNPVDEATGVAVDADPTVTFSSPGLAQASAEDEANWTFKKASDMSDVAFTGSYNVGTRVMTLAPNADLTANTKYIIGTKGTLAAAAGGGSVAAFSFAFTTAP